MILASYLMIDFEKYLFDTMLLNKCNFVGEIFIRHDVI